MIKTVLISTITLLMITFVSSSIMAKEKTKSEVDDEIKHIGSITPEWWDSVELTYPKTLDMEWPVQQDSFKGLSQFGGQEKRGGRGDRGHGFPGGPGSFGSPGEFGDRGGFRGPGEGRGGEFVTDQYSQKIVDQYLIQVIYPNPSRHKEGIKLVNHLMVMHRDDKEKLKRSLNVLGYMFFDLFDDYARAAFWWQKYSQMGGTPDQLKMARCYFELGSRKTAAELLSNIRDTDNKELIKLWAKTGEVDKALKLIDSFSGSKKNNDRMRFGAPERDPQSERYLLAAEICRGAGRYDQAAAYYKKVLGLPDSYTSPMNHHEIDDKLKAKVNLEAVKQLENLDIKQIHEGTYSGTSTAYGGPLTVQVVIKDGIINSVKVTEHWETPSYMVMAEPTARQIVSRQSLEDVDVITGATVTSDAIINSAVAAVFKAMK